MLIQQLPAALVTVVWGPGSPGWECQPSQWALPTDLPYQSHTRPCCSPVAIQHRAAPALAPDPPMSLPARHVLGLCLTQPGNRQGCGARAPGPGLPRVRKVAPRGRGQNQGRGRAGSREPSWGQEEGAQAWSR